MKKSILNISIKMFALLVITFACITDSFGQRVKLHLADYYSSQFDYDSASEVYEDILKKRPHHPQALRKSAQCYSKLGKTSEAELKYHILDSLKLANSEDLLSYADILKQNKNYEKATKIYQKYSSLFPGNSLVQSYSNNPNWYNLILRDSSLFKLNNSRINSESSDFATCFIDSVMVFSSSREDGKTHFKGDYQWNNQEYLNLFEAEITLDTNLVNPKVLDNKVNSRYHEGTVSYDKANQRIFITRNHFHSGKKKKDEKGYLNLAIYETSDLFSEDPEITPFEHNNKSYSVGHPAVDTANNVLYFISDMPGGFGGTDIYKTKWNGTNWDEPENLGNEVNTPLNEMFPHVYRGILYFSSNGHVGLGGLDIYSYDLTSKNISSVGYPLNSAQDDFGIIFSTNGKSGFLSSNRSGGKGDDDIYKFFISMPKFITISGKVIDLETNIPVPDASIFQTLKTQNNAIELITKTDSAGNYEVTLPYSEVFDIMTSKKGYFNEEKRIASNPTSSFLENVDFAVKSYDFLANGKVILAETGTPIEGAKISLLDEDGNEIKSIRSPKSGYYSFGLYEGQQYKITCELDDFALQSTTIDTRNSTSEVFTHDFKMFKIEKGVTVTLDNIYYDYNKSDIRPDAALELNKLVDILNDNPSMRIELSSHTDSRGSDSYNLSLSAKRAESAVNYIISQGITASRITSRGYGEFRIKNKCTNGVTCSEEEHEINRRTEFTIL